MNNDPKLKQALAKMLPEKLLGYTKSDHENYSEEYFHFEWRECDGHNHFDPVLDTELLHLCWLVECSMTQPQQIKYMGCFKCIHAFGPAIPYMESNWQQRTIALAKVKGIEIV